MEFQFRSLSKVTLTVTLSVASTLAMAAGNVGISAANKSFDPLSQDPVITDKAHPPLVHEVTFDSGGVKLYGKVFSAQGTTPHPTVLIARGYPDMTSSADIALTLQRAGFNAMIFNYRGAWGMGGNYSMQNSFEDLRAAVAFLRTYQTSKNMLVDPNNIVLYGYSFGGPIVLRLAAEDPKIRGVLHLDGTDLRAMSKLTPEQKNGWAAGLTTPAMPGVNGVKVIDDIVAHSDVWNPESYAAGLAGKEVFLVWASQGNGSVAREQGTSLHDAYSGQARVTEKTFDTNHDFSDHRIELTRATLAWLEKVRMAPATFTAQAAQDMHKEISMSTEQLAKYAGTYQAPSGPIYFKVDGGHLLTADADQQWLTVIALDNKKFFITNDSEPDCDDIAFTESEGGTVSAMIADCKAGPVTLPRVSDDVKLPKEPQSVSVPESVLKQYVGRYQLPVKFQPAGYLEVALKDGQLTTKPEGGARSLLYAVSDNKFFSRVYKSDVEFVKDDSNAISHMHVVTNGEELNFPRQP